MVESNETIQRLHQENQNLEALKNALDSQEDLIKRKDDEIGALKSRVSELENQPPKEEASTNNQQLIDQHTQALAEKDHAIAQKDQALAEKDKTIAERDQTVSEKQHAIENLNKEIAGLNDQLNAEKAKIDDHANTVNSLSQRIKDLEADQGRVSAEHAQNVEKLNGLITEKDTVISNLKQDLAHSQDEKQKADAAHQAEVAALKEAAHAHEQQPAQGGANSQELEEAHKNAANLQAIIEKQEALLASKIDEIGQLNQKLADQERNHKEIIDDQNAQIDRFSEDVYAKMEEISKLREELDELKSKVSLGTDPENVKTEEGEAGDYH